jgi:hypothetical protein
MNDWSGKVRRNIEQHLSMVATPCRPEGRFICAGYFLVDITRDGDVRERLGEGCDKLGVVELRGRTVRNEDSH